MTSVWTQAGGLLMERIGRGAKPRGETPLERTITTVARSRNAAAAAKVLQSLRAADALDVHALSEMGLHELSEILPKGTAVATARRLRDFSRLVVQDYAGSLEQLGKGHCPAKPTCDACPLVTLLPEGRPLGARSDGLIVGDGI